MRTTCLDLTRSEYPLDLILIALLAPILWVQGVYVRWRTPKLPEAAGARSGTTGQGSPISLLIVGDSAAAGVGVTRQSEALLGHLVTGLAKQFEVRWHLLARTGNRTSDVLKDLDGVAGEYDVVVSLLGVNDVTGLASLTRWVRDQSALVELVRTRLSASQVHLIAVPPISLFPALPNPLRTVLARRGLRFNCALQEIARQKSCYFQEFPASHPNSLELFAGDGFHPGARTYAALGAQLAGSVSLGLEK